jgi:hypothetical protein
MRTTLTAPGVPPRASGASPYAIDEALPAGGGWWHAMRGTMDVDREASYAIEETVCADREALPATGELLERSRCARNPGSGPRVRHNGAPAA